MSNTTTTASINGKLLAEAERLAESLSLSFDDLCSLALTEFILRHKNMKIVEQINFVLSQESDPSDQVFMARFVGHQGWLSDDRW